MKRSMLLNDDQQGSNSKNQKRNKNLKNHKNLKHLTLTELSQVPENRSLSVRSKDRAYESKPRKRKFPKDVQLYFTSGEPHKKAQGLRFRRRHPTLGVVPDLKIHKLLSDFQLEQRKDHLIQLAKLARKDFELLQILQKSLLGTVIQSDCVPRSLLDYTATHPGGYVCLIRTPNLRGTLAYLQMCIRCPSTALVRLLEQRSIQNYFCGQGLFRRRTTRSIAPALKQELRLQRMLGNLLDCQTR